MIQGGTNTLQATDATGRRIAAEQLDAGHRDMKRQDTRRQDIVRQNMKKPAPSNNQEVGDFIGYRHATESKKLAPQGAGRGEMNASLPRRISKSAPSAVGKLHVTALHSCLFTER